MANSVQSMTRLWSVTAMNKMEKRMVYEETMDRISELLEDMILDVMLSALQRIWDKNNNPFDEMPEKAMNTSDDIPF